HMAEAETRALAGTGAVAGLCPTTEANLGDGFFPMAHYKGVWGIGSDSHVSVSPFGELRWLEYGQRLLHGRRHVVGGGTALWQAALAGGARALGQPVGALEPGRRADFVVLRTDLPVLWGKRDGTLLDAAIFAENQNPVRDVAVGGRFVVREGRHQSEERIFAAYKRALA